MSPIPSVAALAEPLSGADGQPLVYPVPLFVKNTFIDIADARPPSLDEFVEERLVRSAPTSMVEGGNEQAADVRRQNPLMGWFNSLVRCKTDVGPARDAAQEEQDDRSECSTADTAEAGSNEQAHSAQRVGSADPALTSAPEPSAAMAMEGFPSTGSQGHYQGDCKPCAFFNSKGCKSGLSCPFCHLCEPGEKKRRQKEKRMFFTNIRRSGRSFTEADGRRMPVNPVNRK